jgi:hypothetical protein
MELLLVGWMTVDDCTFTTTQAPPLRRHHSHAECEGGDRVRIPPMSEKSWRERALMLFTPHHLHFLPSLEKTATIMEALLHHRKAIEYNNIGLSCWNSGDGIGAIQFLFTSYHHCKKSLKYADITVDGNQAAGSIDDIISRCLQDHFEMQYFGRNVFQRGIRIPTTLETHPRSTLLQAIVFNLAMVHHLVAKWNDSELDQGLLRALRSKGIEFYQLGLSLHDKGCGIYSIGILNNLGHLYFSLGDEERSMSCFSQMLSRMTRLTEEQRGEGITIIPEAFAQTATLILRGYNAAEAA